LGTPVGAKFPQNSIRAENLNRLLKKNKGRRDMKKLMLATKNRGKLKEFQEILTEFEITGLNESGLNAEIAEDGASFRENALKKAQTIAKIIGAPVLADDSGLCADALGGRPGVFSARFAGEDATGAENIGKLLSEMKGVPFEKRAARFVCTLCLAAPDEAPVFAEGVCEGVILEAPRGGGGFGYDPVFYLPEFDRTFGELPETVKNEISHRARAVRALRARPL
jgi:XTP/dITP diphosphohydrolase